MDASPIVHSGSPALVGRDMELAVLREGLEQARAGHLRIVLLSGEPGIGKSRLLDEFPSHEIAGAGLMVLRGGATRGEGLPPYLPFIEALGDYSAAVSVEALREVVGNAGAVLAGILPALAERLRPLAPPLRVAPEEERLRLFEATAALVARIARPAPVVLSLDDLQWADTATCELLVHMARRLANSGILVLGAYRDAEADDNPSFVHALAELTRLRALRIMQVGRLNIAQSAALASDLLGGEIPEAVAAALHRQGEGNPFCLEELTRGLIEEGSLTRRDGRWALGRPVEQRLPPGLTATIRSRLSRLPSQSLDVLAIGAVVGRGFDLDVIAAASGADVVTIETSLLPAVRGAVVHPRADGSYAFTHDTIRETLYTDLAPGRARRLHLAIGEALESLAPQQAQGLAFHFVKAGDVERGVRYAQAAAEHALQAHAPAEAVSYYQQAAELIARRRPDDPRSAQVQLALGEARTRAGDFNAAVTNLRRAADAAQLDHNSPLAADAWRRVGGVRWRQEQLLEARLAFERALEFYGDADGLGAAETLLQLADLMALEAGVELRENFSVQEIVWDGDRVVGVRGRSSGGPTVTERARVVVGADGMRSFVARSVQAPLTEHRPGLTCSYYSYWSGVPAEGLELYPRPGNAVIVMPTHADQTCIAVQWPVAAAAAVRADVEGGFLKVLKDCTPSVAERVRAGQRVERFSGSADLPFFYRQPYGPGWALIGDAGYHQDPGTGQGISDAFRDAEVLASALDSGFSDREPLDAALDTYTTRREAASRPMYELTYKLTQLLPPSADEQQLFGALIGNEAETTAFFGALAGTVPIQSFFAPENIGRIVGAAMSRAA